MNRDGMRDLLRYAGWCINHLLWPARCMVCDKYISEDDGGLCLSCWQSLASVTGGDYCGRCGVSTSRYSVVDGRCTRCRDRELQYDGIVRAGIYSEALRSMILRFKLYDRTELDSKLCGMLNAAFTGSDFFEDIDLIVPVPLHWSRKMKRGFNQSELLAKSLKHPDARYRKLLRRNRRTVTQTSMSSIRERKKNIRGVFSVSKPKAVKGRCICLVDDVMTSGATLSECAAVLKQAGASGVYCAVTAVA